MLDGAIDTSCYYEHKTNHSLVVIVRFLGDDKLEVESRSFGAQPAWEIDKKRFLAEYKKVTR